MQKLRDFDLVFLSISKFFCVEVAAVVKVLRVCIRVAEIPTANMYKVGMP